MIWAEFAVVLVAILVGARVGGVGLGTVAGIGLAVLVLVFGMPPSSPPGQVLAIILAVVTAAATMQAAGGMDLMVTLAEKALRAKPQWITFLGPAVAYVFTFVSGTGHVAYAILPVIAEVSRKAGVRPERPLSISVIASQQAITASPLAAATAGLLALLDAKGLLIGGHKVELWHILAICIPATFCGCMIGALSVCRMGKELKDDPEYQARLAAGQIEAPKPAAKLEGAAKRNAIGSVTVFLSAAALIVVLGMFASLRPTYALGNKNQSVSFAELEKALSAANPDNQEDVQVPLTTIEQRITEMKSKPVTERLSMAAVIQIVMYAGAGIMMLFFGASPSVAIKTPVASAGVVAVISVLGLGWMGNCFFEGNQPAIVAALSEIIKEHPWVFAVGLFTLSVLLFSQASTVAALMPLGIALGIPAPSLIAFFPAVNGYFFLPTYGTIVAAVSFDQTGTTRIGKYVLNHSFMLPGLVATTSAIGIGLAISRILF
jgi:anaerobic C4-dicarboxylate transporter DcuA